MIDPTRIQSETQPLPALRIPRPIDVYPLQTTAATIFTARADADFQISHLAVANVTAAAATYTIHLVPDGDAAGAANMVVRQASLSASSGGVVFEVQGMMLQPGMTIQALCSSNDAVNIFGWGYDYQGVYA